MQNITIVAITCFLLLNLCTVNTGSYEGKSDLLEYIRRGLYRRRHSKRVIGGEQTLSDEEQAFLVSLEGKMGGWFWKKTYRYCGGSVINDYWVLTAAHCFNENPSPRRWTVRLASRKLTGGIADRIGHLFGKIFGKDEWLDVERDATKIVIHPQYNANNLWKHDIALVKLSEPVPSGKNFQQIRAISLPVQGDSSWPKDGQNCIMIGWGCSKAGGSVERRSMKVILPKVSDSECTRTWGVRAVDRLCAGHNYRSKGICPGDSGGPLVCKQEGTMTQFGIASFTSRDTPGDKPGAFTRVSQYTTWIQTTIRRN